MAERREEAGRLGRALEVALRFLGPRARSVAEVRERLGRDGYPPEVIDGVISRLQAQGLLDDLAFARAWLEARDRAHPRATRALWAELRRKGVDAEVIRVAMAERAAAAGGEADVVAARRLLARRRRLLGRLEPGERSRRAYSLLVRAGFSTELARVLAREVEGDGGS